LKELFIRTANVNKGEKTILQVAKELYTIQRNNKYTYTTQDCIDYAFSCLVTNTIKGFKMEEKAYNIFKDTSLYLEYASSIFDNEYSVDIIAYYGKKIIGAIQVKPTTYLYSDNEGCVEDKQRNKRNNLRFENNYNVCVNYFYYNKQNEEFHYDRICGFINKMIINLKELNNSNGLISELNELNIKLKTEHGLLF
jgi:hypothetical protein